MFPESKCATIKGPMLNSLVKTFYLFFLLSQVSIADEKNEPQICYEEK